jgi:SdpC family antimicrobial peptide
MKPHGSLRFARRIVAPVVILGLTTAGIANAAPDGEGRKESLEIYTDVEIVQGLFVGVGPFAADHPQLAAARGSADLISLQLEAVWALDKADSDLFDGLRTAMESGRRPRILRAFEAMQNAIGTEVRERIESLSPRQAAAVKPMAVLTPVAIVVAIVVVAAVAVAATATYTVTAVGGGSSGGSKSKTTCGASRPCRIVDGLSLSTANEITVDQIASTFG